MSDNATKPRSWWGIERGQYPDFFNSLVECENYKQNCERSDEVGYRIINVIEKSAYDEAKEKAFEFETKYNRVNEINKKYVDDVWRKHTAKLEAENTRLREALEFYSKITNWYDSNEVTGLNHCSIWKDSEDVEIKSIKRHIVVGGRRARQTLKELAELGEK